MTLDADSKEFCGKSDIMFVFYFPSPKQGTLRDKL